MVVKDGGAGESTENLKRNQKTLKKVSAVEPKMEVYVLWAFDTKRKTLQEALLILKASMCAKSCPTLCNPMD